MATRQKWVNMPQIAVSFSRCQLRSRVGADVKMATTLFHISRVNMCIFSAGAKLRAGAMDCASIAKLHLNWYEGVRAPAALHGYAIRLHCVARNVLASGGRTATARLFLPGKQRGFDETREHSQRGHHRAR